MRRTFRYILEKDDKWWLAMCLDHNFVAQGKTKKAAIKELEVLMKLDTELAKEVGVESHVDVVEPKGWFKETFDIDPTFHKIYTLTVDLP